jgi:uncharacterized beta-barrel protein YwiB (DUF1934 family)
MDLNPFITGGQYYVVSKNKAFEPRNKKFVSEKACVVSVHGRKCHLTRITPMRVLCVALQILFTRDFISVFAYNAPERRIYLNMSTRLMQVLSRQETCSPGGKVSHAQSSIRFQR